MITLSEKDNETIKKIIENSKEKIQSSSSFLALYSAEWKEDPVPLLQLAIAIILDKPIILLAIQGVPIPENLKKLAVITEKADTLEELPQATERMLKKMRLLTQPF